MFKKSFYTRIAKELAESGNEIKSAKAHKEIKTMETKVTEFKGRNVLQIIGNGEDKFPFTFGLRKAKLILEAVEEIKMFVAAEESKAPAEKPAKKTKKTVAKSPAVVLETV